MHPKTPLRRRLDACVAASDIQSALTTAALAEASEVLDASITGEPGAVERAGSALFDVALLHLIRAMGRQGHPDQRHEQAAQMALYVLIAVAAPDWLPPHMRDAVQTAIDRGAPTDVSAAVVKAMWGHADAVRAAFDRAPQLDLADVLVRAYQRVIEVAGPTVPGYPTRLLNLADAFDARHQARQPEDPATVADVQAAADLVEDSIAADPKDPGVLLRTHLIRGRVRLHRWRLLAEPADLDAAAESYQRAVDLSGPDSPHRAECLDQLRTVQELRTRPADHADIYVFQPANTGRGRAPRVYQPDHTAHIRERLKAMLLRSAIGVAFGLVGAVLIRWQTSGLDDRFRSLATVAWWVDIALLLVSTLGMVMTLVPYLVYRHRRADLDAAGAEAIGELMARLHRR